jgi:tRNA dimethylallyltransferase
MVTSRAAATPRSPLPSPPILLAGPTAVGKSEVALRLAEQLGGEIISFDSMQVYRGMDIGTAKPAPADRLRVPHHLIDVADVIEPFDAAKFAKLAHQAAREIQARGHGPILCGGTGLYFQAFLEGLGQAPPADPKMRAELEATPLVELLRELARRDPVTYEKIDRRNPRRVIRAVEAIRLSGQPFSAQRANWSPAARRAPFAARCFGLTRSIADLRARIDGRVEQMFQRGLVEETRQLLERGLGQNRTAMQAIGYRQVVEHLRGERSLPETIERVKIRTRQLAKRQMTWFRRRTDWNWIELATTDEPAAVVKRICRLILLHAKDGPDAK